MSRTPVEGFYSSCFLRFPRFHIEWTVWNGVNSHNLMKSIQKQIYVFFKICSLSTLSSLFWLARQELSEASEINVWPNGSHHRVHCVCRPYFLDNVGIKTPHQAILGYTFMQTQTMLAQKTVQRIIHFKAVSLAIASQGYLHWKSMPLMIHSESLNFNSFHDFRTIQNVASLVEHSDRSFAAITRCGSGGSCGPARHASGPSGLAWHTMPCIFLTAVLQNFRWFARYFKTWSHRNNFAGQIGHFKPLQKVGGS